MKRSLGTEFGTADIEEPVALAQDRRAVQYLDSPPESRAINDQRTVLAGFAAGMDAATHLQFAKLDQRRRVQLPPQPFLTEPVRLSGDNDGLEASVNEFPEQVFLRFLPDGKARGKLSATALGGDLFTMAVEQDVAEDAAGDPALPQ